MHTLLRVSSLACAALLLGGCGTAHDRLPEARYTLAQGQVLPLAERCVGARGLLRPEPFERLHRDLTHYLRQPAPDAALADAGRYALAHARPAYRLWHE